MPEAFSDENTAGKEGRAYVILLSFLNYWSIILSRRRKR
jgi:hypothetical protein